MTEHQHAPDILVLPPATNGYRRSLFPGRGVSVYYDRHPANEWPEHSHGQEQVSGLLDEVEIFLKVLVNGIWEAHRIQGPSVWVIPAGVPHALTYPQEADMVTLFAERHFVQEALGDHQASFALIPLAQMASRDTLIGRLTKEFRRLCRSEEKRGGLYVEAIGTMLGTHILQALFQPDAKRDRHGGLPDAALAKVIRHIDEHFGDTLDLKALGHTASLSVSHFGRLFKKSFGLTPHDYVMRQRVAKAEELLETTALKEIDIALSCGFSDDTLMARWFRRILDCTPREVRAQAKK